MTTPSESLAGFDAVVLDPAQPRELPPAPYVDKRTNDSPLDDDGFVQPLHPVDSQVLIGLGIRQGTIAGDTTIGHTFHLVNLAQGAGALQADVEQRARTANPIKRLLAAGDIEILSVKGERIPNGLQVVTHYRNLRTGKAGRVQS